MNQPRNGVSTVQVRVHVGEDKGQKTGGEGRCVRRFSKHGL